MLSRLLERGKTSGRDDDNIESIKKRFGELRYHAVNTTGFSLIRPSRSDLHETTMPVIEYYEEFGKVAKVGSKSLWQSLLLIHATAGR
jgi:UMP-CMP kinase